MAEKIGLLIAGFSVGQLCSDKIAKISTVITGKHFFMFFSTLFAFDLRCYEPRSKSIPSALLGAGLRQVEGLQIAGLNLALRFTWGLSFNLFHISAFQPNPI